MWETSFSGPLMASFTRKTLRKHGFVEAYTHHNNPSDHNISLHGSVSKWGEPSIDPAEPLNSKRYPSFQETLHPTD